jgi:hypothetical protein
MKIDIKGVIAILVVLGCFGMLGIYLYQGKPLEPGIAAVIAGAFNLVLGFYFGHLNGAQEAQTTAALKLAQQALVAVQQRRAGDPPVVTAPAVVVPPIPPTV